MKKAIVLILVALILATANAFGSTSAELASAGVGNGEVYAGGDFLERTLLLARDKLNQSFALIHSGFDVENLCSVDSCRKSKDTSLCHALASLTPAQRDDCRKFLVSKSSDLERMNSVSSTPYHLSQVPLMVKQKAGGLRPVNAMTKAGAGGAIMFHHGSISNASFEAVIALITHELGHKIDGATPSTPILDDTTVGTFSSGRQFLDAIGAAAALYSLEHSSPSQAAPALPDKASLADACSIAKDSRKRFLVGLSFDTTGKMPLPDTMETWLSRLTAVTYGNRNSAHLTIAQKAVASPEARTQVIRKIFRKHLLREPSQEEIAMMIERVSGGIPYEAIVASILGDEEYASSRGSVGNNQFVASVYLDLLGKNPAFQETKALLAQLQKMDRSSVVLAILKKDNEGWKKWVTEWYEEWLNRSPSSQELDIHVGDLRSGAGWESVKAWILSSPEYFTLQSARFQPCDKMPSRGIASRH